MVYWGRNLLLLALVSLLQLVVGCDSFEFSPATPKMCKDQIVASLVGMKATKREASTRNQVLSSDRLFSTKLRAVKSGSVSNSVGDKYNYAGITIRNRLQLSAVIKGSVDQLVPGQLMTSSPTFVSFPLQILHWYTHQLQFRPLLTKMLTSGFIAGIGDLIVQLNDTSMKNNLFNLNLVRLVEFFMVNSLFIGPALHVWFNALAKLPIPTRFTSIYTKTAYQILIDQTVGAAWITIGFFVVYEFVHKLCSSSIGTVISPLWMKELMDSIIATISLRLWKTLLVGRMFWPVINYINFIYVPLEYRVLASNLAAIFWNMFLSSLLNSKSK